MEIGVTHQQTTLFLVATTLILVPPTSLGLGLKIWNSKVNLASAQIRQWLGELHHMPPLDIVDREEVYWVEPFQNIEDKDEDINTSSNGKVIQSSRPCGNLSQLSLMMAIYWTPINNDINCKKDIHQMTSYMTSDKIYSNSSNNTWRRQWQKLLDQTTHGSRTTHWQSAVWLLEDTLHLSYLYQLSQLLPSTFQWIHHWNPQWLLYLLNKTNMPWSYQYKTPNVPHWSISSFSTRYSPSHHFSGWYVDINTFAESINWHDDLSTVVTMLEEDPVSFAKFVFLDYLCHNLKRIQQDLGNQQNIAWHRLTHFFQWQSTIQVYDWIFNRHYRHWWVIPGSDHTPPDSSTNSSQSRALPIPPQQTSMPPIWIWTSPTVTKAQQWQWRKNSLKKNSLKTHYQEHKKIQ